MARLIERAVTTFTPTDSTQDRQHARMPLGATIQAYRIRFTGTLTVGVAVATILEDSPLGYLRSVDLVLGGGFPLRVHDARFVRVLNTMQYGAAPRITAPAGAIGATNFAAELTVDLWQPDLRASIGLDRAFWLDSRVLSSLELVPTFGVAADVATAGGGGTVALSNLSFQVTAQEVLDQGGLLSRMQILRQVVQAVPAAGVLDLQPFSGGGVVYRGFWIHATSHATLTDPNRQTSDDTIVGDVSVVDSRGIRLTDAVPWEQLRAETKRAYGFETVPAGWVFVDFAKAHHLADLWDTRGAQAVQMRFTIAAAPANSFLQVYPMVALLRRRASAPAAAGGARF